MSVGARRMAVGVVTIVVAVRVLQVGGTVTMLQLAGRRPFLVCARVACVAHNV